MYCSVRTVKSLRTRGILLIPPDINLFSNFTEMFRCGNEVDPSLFKTLVETLKSKPLPKNLYRANSGIGKSQCFGVVKQRNHRYAGSRMNLLRPELYLEILRIAAAILPPDFTWTGCQLNQNYRTEPHKDNGNMGESCILGFGEYEGGELVIEETPVNIRNRMVFFDGSLYVHSTKDWTGDRYSLVFHRPDRTFKEIPKYSIVETVERGLLVYHLREELASVVRIFRSDRSCVSTSDGVMPIVRGRRPTLRECIE